ncbi:MAG: acylphosphatase [Candidatus Micrarchaeota archaeon]
MKERLHILVSGDVQGVFFRANAQNEARRLGLTGWVRNLEDGRVEAVAEGERNALEKFLEWCGRGPAGASVSGIESEWLAYQGEFRDFSIRYGR